MDEAATKHARLALGRVVKDAGLSRRYAFLAVHEIDLDPVRAPAEPGRLGGRVERTLMKTSCQPAHSA